MERGVIQPMSIADRTKTDIPVIDGEDGYFDPDDPMIENIW